MVDVITNSIKTLAPHQHHLTITTYCLKPYLPHHHHLLLNSAMGTAKKLVRPHIIVHNGRQAWGFYSKQAIVQMGRITILICDPCCFCFVVFIVAMAMQNEKNCKSKKGEMFLC